MIQINEVPQLVKDTIIYVLQHDGVNQGTVSACAAGLAVETLKKESPLKLDSFEDQMRQHEVILKEANNHRKEYIAMVMRIHLDDLTDKAIEGALSGL